MARFQKGQSGNPGGRPKSAKGLREQLEAKYGVGAPKLIARLDAMSVGKNERVAFEATRLLMAYHFGPPVQKVETSGPDGQPAQSEARVTFGGRWKPKLDEATA
jgi:hypothetical protein